MVEPRLFIACTGAGAGAQAEIWKAPGCSSYFAGACFPYGEDQLEDFIGYRSAQFCSRETAIEMALAAYYRAAEPGRPAIGVGLSASVASTRPHRGEHRIHAAAMTDSGAWTLSQLLLRGSGGEARERDGRAADRIVADMLDYARHGSWPDTVLGSTAEAEALFFARPLWTATGERRPATALRPRQPLFPGAFNPPHAAHVELAERHGAAFAIDATPPHKPALGLGELVRRAKALRGHDRLFTTGAPLYLDKSNRFPDRPFIIGADALIRMFDPKWGPQPEALLCELNQNGTSLLVVGRAMDGRFVSAEEAIALVPESMRFDLIPVDGRWDVSSTELRAAG